MLGFLSFDKLLVQAEGEDDVFVLRETRPYLFVDFGVDIDLTTIAYKTIAEDVLLSNGDLTDLSASLVQTGDLLQASSAGIHTFTFTSGEESIKIYVFAKAVEDTEYIIYEENFDGLSDGAIPSDFTLVKGAAGIENEYLYLDSPATSTPSQVLLPEYLKGFKNYIIETDFTLLSAVESTRWASVMYRFSLDNYFQMAIRQNATADNGVEFAKAINGNWNVPITIAYSEAINPATTYRLKIDLKGSVVKESINDSLLITYESASDYSSGYIGMQSSGSKAIYDNIKITMPVEYIDNSTVEYSNIPVLYTPESGIIVAPTAIKTIDSLEDIQALGDEIRPATAFLRINSNFDVVKANGLPICTFMEALDAAKDKVIPAFYTKNNEIALTIASMLKTYGVRDAFIVSPNISVIQTARAEYNMLRGILEISYDNTNPVLSDADLLEIRDNTNIAGAVATILPIEYTNQYNVFYLQHRLITVWAETSDLGNEAMLEAILSGSNGIVTDDYLSLFDLYATFPENTLIRRPLIIGHRGMSTEAPENTVEGSVLAMNAGADVVELDIYLSLDNEIIVMHDATTTRTTNGSLIVEESTLAQLRELTMNDTFGTFPDIPVPTLEEYFETFKGEDLVLFIEIKSSNVEIVDYLKLLIDEYDFSDQVVVISFIGTQITKMREVLPNISVGYLSTGLINSANLESSIIATLNSVVPAKTTINPEYSPLTDVYIQEMNHRGLTIWPWTLSTPENVYTYYLKGVGGITTDITSILQNEFNRFTMNQLSYTYDLAEPAQISLRGNIMTPKGFSYPYIPTLEIYSDTGTGIVIDSSSNVTEMTTVGNTVLMASFTTTLASGEEVTIYSDLIQIEVIDTTEEIVDPDPVDPDPVDPDPVDPDPVDDTNPLGWIIGAISGGVVFITGFIFLGIRFLKKPKI